MNKPVRSGGRFGCAFEFMLKNVAKIASEGCADFETGGHAPAEDSLLDATRKKQLDALLRMTIGPALFEDLGIDSDEDPQTYNAAIEYLSKGIETLKV